MSRSDDVAEHYASGAPADDLVARVRATVEALEPGALEAASAAGFDHFHIRGIAATAELAKLARIDSSTGVLDAGSGFGGPARYIARTCGAHVLGVDLTPAFVEIARFVSHRLRLDDRTTFEVGDIAALPCADRSVDVVWTQHVVMNVPDRDRVYREFRRVLRPGGNVAFYDVIAADEGEPPYYPVPWAESEATSFLATRRETMTAFEGAGFDVAAFDDVTAGVAAWIATAPAPMPQGLSLATLIGPRFGASAANFARNVREGRIRVVMGIANARA